MVSVWHKSHTAVKMATFLQKVGDNIRKIRKHQGITQEQLSSMARLDPKSVIKIESGQRNATLKTIKRIASALKVKAAQLLEE